MKSFKQKSIFGKVTTIFGILILAIVLYIAYLMISFSISSSLEKTRYEKVATHIEDLAPKLNSVDDKAKWIKNIYCQKEYSGDFSTGEYRCSAKLTLTFNTKDPKSFLDLSNKYHQILDAQADFKPANSYKELPVSSIGKKLVESLAEQNYESEGVYCLYYATLNQTDEKAKNGLTSYGNPIVGDVAEAQYNLWCTGKTMGAWYDVADR